MVTEPVTSGWLLFARSYWMMFGPALLFILTIQIIRGADVALSIVDGIYFVGLGGILLARWFEFRKDQSLDSYGEPMKPGDLQRFVVRTILVEIAIWVVAKLLGIYWPI